jgi:hypothetical protein
LTLGARIVESSDSRLYPGLCSKTSARFSKKKSTPVWSPCRAFCSNRLCVPLHASLLISNALAASASRAASASWLTEVFFLGVEFATRWFKLSIAQRHRLQQLFSHRFCCCGVVFASLCVALRLLLARLLALLATPGQFAGVLSRHFCVLGIEEERPLGP